MGNRKLNPLRSTLPGPKMVSRPNVKSTGKAAVTNPAPKPVSVTKTGGVVTKKPMWVSPQPLQVFVPTVNLNNSIFGWYFGDATDEEKALLDAKLKLELGDAWRTYNDMMAWATDETLHMILEEHKPEMGNYKISCACGDSWDDDNYFGGCIAGKAYESLNRRQVTDKALAEGMPAALVEGML